MNNHTDLINRAQSDLKEHGQISQRDAQALIDALNELTSSKVFVCNNSHDDMQVNKITDWKYNK